MLLFDGKYICMYVRLCVCVCVCVLSVCVCVRAMSSRVHGVFAHEVARVVMTFPWHGVWAGAAAAAAAGVTAA